MEEGGKDLVLIMMNDGRSSLLLAADRGHEAIAWLLIEAGGEDLLFVNIDTHGTALYKAASNGHVEIVRLLNGAGGQRLLFLTPKTTNRHSIVPPTSDTSTCRGCSSRVAARGCSLQIPPTAPRRRTSPRSADTGRWRACCGGLAWPRRGLVCRRRWRL